MIFIYLEAPFAAFRSFAAGWYRPTCQFLTPTAAYGLLLNVAGIEMRLTERDASHSGSVPASLIRDGLPQLKLALGIPIQKRHRRSWVEVEEENRFPNSQTIFQQLHNYPVGSSGKDRAESTRGNKYNITPVRREFLSNVRAVIALETDADTEGQILQGLAGAFNDRRYGLPFLGDNAFLLNRLEVVDDPPKCCWLVEAEQDDTHLKRVSRATVWIDRACSAQTKTLLLKPTTNPNQQPDEMAWFSLPA